jgi:hypothetical protein
MNSPLESTKSACADCIGCIGCIVRTAGVGVSVRTGT